MRVTSTLLLAFITLLSCTKKPMDNGNKGTATTPDTSSVSNPAPSGQFTYLALGDSYTIGEAVGQNESYPYQLTNQLRQNKVDVADPVIIARTGWTTGDLKRAIENAALNQKFSFVTLLIGVNNQYQHLSSEIYRTEFDDLVNTAVNFAGGNKSTVIVLSIPDWSVTPFAANKDTAAIKSEINLFNDINEAESGRMGVIYLNITDISRLAKADPTLIAQDGLHPSGKMYMLWVQRLLPLVLNRLKK